MNALFNWKTCSKLAALLGSKTLLKNERYYYCYCKVLLVAFTIALLTGEIAVNTQLTYKQLYCS